jgi:hypothetical protein
VTSGIVMFDATDLSQIPAGPAAVAGYVDGLYQTAPALAARFPHAHLLTIAVSAADDADCLDVETGDATPAQAPAWYERQQARGVFRPCLYASVSVMQSQVIPALQAAGISRADVRLWTAHYAGLHRCGPSACGELSTDADGTQWTDVAYGRQLDQSLLLPGFFAVPAPAPAPSPAPAPVNWLEAIVRELPTLQQGSSGEDVRTVQGLCTARGRDTTVDGDFGALTEESVKGVQQATGITADGIVGPATWPVLITGSAA